MNANKIEKGKQYEITVGKNSTVVKVVEIERRVNGTLVFQCENVKTGKAMTIADPERFRKEIKPEKKASNPIGNAAKRLIGAMGFGPGSAKAEEEANAAQQEHEATKERGKGGKSKGNMSGLEAAHTIIDTEKRAMNVKEITDLAIQRGLWAPEGKTPSATVASAIMREIVAKGENSRFFRAERGKFATK